MGAGPASNDFEGQKVFPNQDALAQIPVSSVSSHGNISAGSLGFTTMAAMLLLNTGHAESNNLRSGKADAASKSGSLLRRIPSADQGILVR